MSVADMLIASGVWNWAACFFPFPQEIVASIMSIPCNPSASTDDGWAWKFILNGKFDFKSAYDFAFKRENSEM